LISNALGIDYINQSSTLYKINEVVPYLVQGSNLTSKPPKNIARESNPQEGHPTTTAHKGRKRNYYVPEILCDIPPHDHLNLSPPPRRVTTTYLSHLTYPQRWERVSPMESVKRDWSQKRGKQHKWQGSARLCCHL